MALTLEEKRAIVAEMTEVVANAHSAVIAEYIGMSVAEMTDLRNKARESQVYIRVVKNTLAKRAIADTPFECMVPALVGPVILAFSQDAPGAAARLLFDFTKTNKKLVVKNIALGGQLLDGAKLESVSKLPNREEAISQLMSVLQAPVTQFVRTLAEPHAKFVRTMAALGDSKEGDSHEKDAA